MHTYTHSYLYTHTFAPIHTHIYHTLETDTISFTHSVSQKDYQPGNSLIFPLNFLPTYTVYNPSTYPFI